MAEEEKKKFCGRCSHYGCLINQGMWWCNFGHTDNMDAETCEDYDDALEGCTMSTTSTYTSKNMLGQYTIKQPGEMAKFKVDRAKRKRRKERGIKHGRR